MDPFITYDGASFNARIWAAVSEEDFIKENEMHFPHLNLKDKIEVLKAAHGKCRETMGITTDKKDNKKSG